MLNYMILGTLMERPYHGYELKSSVFKKIALEFGINDGQLYPMLKKLENNDLVDMKIEPQENSPSRHVYYITDKGRKEFRQWLLSNAGEEKSYRYEFLRKDAFFIRCTFIQYLDKATALQKISHELARVDNDIADLQQASKSMLEKGVSPIRISLLEFGLKNQEMRYNWLLNFRYHVENNM